MEVTANKKVAEVVSANIKSAHIFKKFGIDFCCGGGISIEEACRKKNLDKGIVLTELATLENSVDRAHDYVSWPVDFLADHIQNIHHAYVLQSLPLLIEYSEKVQKVHGHHYKEQIEIRNLILEANRELLSHMKKEEMILFPYIRSLVDFRKKNQEIKSGIKGMVSGPISVMENEHEIVGEIFKKIRSLTNDYTCPPDACNTFRALYSLLEEFEQDLHLHIHLENNILFPKTKKLENELLSEMV